MDWLDKRPSWTQPDGFVSSANNAFMDPEYYGDVAY